MANNTNWLNISSMSGSSGQTILTLSANRNLSTNYKTAEITAYNPVYNISAKTYVTIEAYSPYIEISPTLIPVADSGGTFELSISANCSWVIAYPDLVSSYSTTAGTGDRTITFSVPSTTADTTLVGNIVVTDESGQVSRTARIEQYGSGAHIGIFPVELYFDSTGGSQTFSVTADCAYNVSMSSGSSWARVTPNSGYTGQTTFTVTVNSGYTGDTQRVTTVLIDAPGTGGVVAVYQNKPETRLIVGYYVTSTTEPTVIMNTSGLSGVSLAEYPDGTQITPATAYTFPATGMQYVYYTLAGDTVPESMFDSWDNYNALSGTVKTVFIPNGITGVGRYAFYRLSGLTSVTLPDTLEVLSSSCFLSCAFSSITLPNSLSSIGNACFSGCTSLSSITIPSGVTSIGQSCFTGSSVSSITFTSLTPPVLAHTNSLTSSTLSEIIVPCPAVNDYITAWPQYAQYISCSETGTTLYFVTDTSNVKGIGETRTITILNTNINPNGTGLNLPSDFPQQGSYTVVGNTIYLTYPRNPSSSATRSWTIGVVGQTNDGVNLSGSYTITQDANTIYSIPYTADTSTVDASGETRTITIDTSNLVASSITIGVEGATGVSYTYNNGVITVTFPPNSGDSLDGQRNVVVTITGETLDGKEAYASIAFTQDYEYTGEKRLFIIYEVGDQNTFRSIIYGHTAWAKVSKVELANGTDITNDIVFCGDSESPQWGYNFGVGGFYGLYFTFLNNAIPAYAFDQIGNIRLIVVPDTITTIEDEAFDGTDSPIISFGKGLEEVHRKILQFSSIQKIVFNSQTAPVIPAYIVDSYSNLFYDVPSGGTMFYPCGSDYSNYTNVLENEHSWNSVCFTESGVPSSSYVYQAYLLGDLSVVNISGETRTFNVGGLLDDSSTYYFDVVGPTGTTYTTSGGTITVTFPQCEASVENEIYMEVTATSYNGLFLGTGRTVLTQKEVIEPVIPLTFVVESGGTILWKTSSYNMTGRPIKYRINNGSWTTITSTTADSASFRVSPGDIVEIAGDNTRYGYDYQYYNFFSASSGCKFSVKGNIMSLLNSTGFSEMTTFTTGNVFSNLFKDCKAITSAEKLLLPATTLTTSCYESMFKGCSNMTIAPKLPAETLYNGCYNTMFSGCTNLSSITCYATNVSTAYTDYWVNGVSIVGTFTTPSTTQWTTGVSGIPSGWTRVNSDT